MTTHQKTWTDLLGRFDARAVVADCGEYAVISRPNRWGGWSVLWTFEDMDSANAAYAAWEAGN